MVSNSALSQRMGRQWICGTKTAALHGNRLQKRSVLPNQPRLRCICNTRSRVRVSFEIGSEVTSKAQFSVSGEEMEYMLFGGETLRDVLVSYTDLTGKPALPPAWSFGLWLTTSFTTSYDEETVNHFVDGMEERHIPLHVFHYDCFWMREFRWCDFTFDRRMFPDPAGMLRRMKSRGLKICVWINPYIGQLSSLFPEAAEKGYLLTKPNGDIYQTDLWQAGMGIVDFTNPEAVSWYQQKLQDLVDLGLDCFKTDFGERIPTNVVYWDASDPERMHNYYTYLYNKRCLKCWRKTMEKARLFFSPDLEQRAANSSPSIGEATAPAPTNLWRKPCGAVFPFLPAATPSGATISAVLKIQLHRIFISVGALLAFFPPIADFTAAAATEFPGISTKKPLTCSVSS